jgi:uncharacterized glyoxalase superfamily protein PhnB
VDNVDRSVSFYQSRFGFDLIDKVVEDDKTSWAEVGLGACRLMMQARDAMLAEIPALQSSLNGGSSVLVLRLGSGARVRSIYEVMASTERVAMHLRETEYGSVEFAIFDPDGYVVLCAGGQ